MTPQERREHVEEIVRRAEERRADFGELYEMSLRRKTGVSTITITATGGDPVQLQLRPVYDAETGTWHAGLFDVLGEPSDEPLRVSSSGWQE